mmetsp:Transcript_10412/g.38612  ORF Transcript_10412/g.38612 Transcript_10412/m.38612 type:complete len:377 (-) Transcript_10412:1094-2224(-)
MYKYLSYQIYYKTSPSHFSLGTTSMRWTPLLMAWYAFRGGTESTTHPATCPAPTPAPACLSASSFKFNSLSSPLTTPSIPCLILSANPGNPRSVPTTTAACDETPAGPDGATSTICDVHAACRIVVASDALVPDSAKTCETCHVPSMLELEVSFDSATTRIAALSTANPSSFPSSVTRRSPSGIVDSSKSSSTLSAGTISCITTVITFGFSPWRLRVFPESHEESFRVTPAVFATAAPSTPWFAVGAAAGVTTGRTRPMCISLLTPSSPRINSAETRVSLPQNPGPLGSSRSTSAPFMLVSREEICRPVLIAVGRFSVPRLTWYGQLPRVMSTLSCTSRTVPSGQCKTARWYSGRSWSNTISWPSTACILGGCGLR